MEKTSHSRTVSGIAWMILGSGGQTVFQFVLFIVLARELGPQAFGLVGIAAVFIELSGALGRAGLTEVIIQQKSLHDDEASTAFWSSIGIGTVFTVTLFALSGPMESAFSAPGLKPVMELLSLTCLLFAGGAVYEAMLRREFGFKALAARNVTATLVSGVVALVMALTGFGVYSLVAQRLIYMAWLLVAMVYATRWWPRMVWKPATARRQLAGGSTLAVASVLGSGNQRIIDLIVGYVLGATALGYLRISWRALDLLQELSIRPITAVTLTSLSRLQDDRPAFVRGYLRLVQMTAVFAYPMFLGAAVIAPELIAVMFGPQWAPSVPLMQILTLTVIFVPLVFYKSNALMAVGAMRMVLAVNVFEFGASAIVAYVSARYGLEAAAAGNIVRLAVVTPVIFWSVARSAGISAIATLRAVAMPLLASAIMIAVLLLLKSAVPAVPPIVTIAYLAVAGVVVYAGALSLLQPALLKEILGMVLAMAGRTARS
ncbi:lipopolysaccharide biosynthesis protein [Bosea sp. ASV33]|uniref:lipopolysaccharide biosynthesis protein n=1 Tax=Bosea sp. ASV33 TaxID=2795106 RepID=UPI0018ECAA75|nr:lipopolysaccharide biosynthesis protein [Bosea sp. ASV33]